MPKQSMKLPLTSLMPVVKAWWPALLYMAAIFILSAQSKLPELPGPILSWDKSLHLIAYLGLGFVLFRAVSLTPLLGPGLYPQSLLVGALYGASDELHQRFVPGRTMDFFDWLADVMGLALALLIIGIIKNRRANGGK